MRGLAKVRTECRLTVLAYNLRRVLHLVELPRLLAALGCEMCWAQCGHAGRLRPTELRVASHISSCAGAQYGRVGRISRGRATQSSRAGEWVPEAE
jgi:hypothetical protein